jgi:hypothetical protein
MANCPLHGVRAPLPWMILEPTPPPCAAHRRHCGPLCPHSRLAVERGPADLPDVPELAGDTVAHRNTSVASECRQAIAFPTAPSLPCPPLPPPLMLTSSLARCRSHPLTAVPHATMLTGCTMTARCVPASRRAWLGHLGHFGRWTRLDREVVGQIWPNTVPRIKILFPLFSISKLLPIFENQYKFVENP